MPSGEWRLYCKKLDLSSSLPPRRPKRIYDRKNDAYARHRRYILLNGFSFFDYLPSFQLITSHAVV